MPWPLCSIDHIEQPPADPARVPAAGHEGQARWHRNNAHSSLQPPALPSLSLSAFASTWNGTAILCWHPRLLRPRRQTEEATKATAWERVTAMLETAAMPGTARAMGMPATLAMEEATGTPATLQALVAAPAQETMAATQEAVLLEAAATAWVLGARTTATAMPDPATGAHRAKAAHPVPDDRRTTGEIRPQAAPGDRTQVTPRRAPAGPQVRAPVIPGRRRKPLLPPLPEACPDSSNACSTAFAPRRRCRRAFPRNRQFARTPLRPNLRPRPLGQERSRMSATVTTRAESGLL